MKEIINGKRYDTEKCSEVASNEFWDGHNMDRNGRTERLLKTKKGAFLLYRTSRWQGEMDSVTVLSKEEAKEAYEQLPTRSIEWEDAFCEEIEEG